MTDAVRIVDLIRRAAELAATSDSPRLDTEVLLAHVLQVPRSYLFTWPEKVIDSAALATFEALFQRRRGGEPIAYLCGSKEFWSLPLRVNASTLIPRPETELLVQRALGLIVEGGARVLDLGTGTGAIALALASERRGWTIVAVDRLPAVVALAEENRCALGLDNVQIRLGHWFTTVRDLDSELFDLVLSNPPYLDAEDEHLLRGDVRFEPRSALVASDNGLADLSLIIEGARDVLVTGGWLLLEHGFAQGAAVRQWLHSCGYCNIATHSDLGGLERVSEGQWIGPGAADQVWAAQSKLRFGDVSSGSGDTWTRFLPAILARYMALSAAFSRSLAL
ncbi:MAG: peptide chain release factor N(5)-glutamine methyltransferase [Porticoccaceae bacterium]